MPVGSVWKQSLIVAVIATTLAHPGSVRLELDSVVQTLLQLAHSYFVLVISIAVNRTICPCAQGCQQPKTHSARRRR